MTTTDARWSVLTAPNARSAVAVVALESPQLDRLLPPLGLPAIAVGGLRLADLLGVDRGLVARWSDDRADLFCHGGPAVVRALTNALTEAGLAPAAIDPFPEARTPIERAVLAALARASSPRAVDLLLDQPRRWAADPSPASTADPRLDRLIHPPLVAAFGPPNIGKSTLLNALAGRSLALAADRPGTTRDHVGATLDLEGLTVGYLDLPGFDPPGVDPHGSKSAPHGPDAAAQHLALEAARAADLILICADSTAAPLDPPRTDALTLRVGLRRDLGPPCAPVDLAVSALDRTGLADLAVAVRRALVPDAALNDPRPWAFDAFPSAESGHV